MTNETLTIYGASDDLIEIDGYIREEFPAAYEETEYLAFSDGTLLVINYNNDGFWIIKAMHRGPCFLKIDSCDVGPMENDDSYSDIAYFTEGIKWIVKGTDKVSESSKTSTHNA